MHYSKNTSANANANANASTTFRRLPLTKKTALKKEFSIDTNSADFPSINETIKRNENHQQYSFSSAAAKKIAVPEVIKADVEPGWVHIRKYNNTIQYKYGLPVVKPDDTYRADTILGNCLFKYRLEKAQYERDMDVARLGDLSEYYGEPPLAEIYLNDIILTDNVSDIDTSDNEYEEIQ
jgi:hypothetical protein